MYVHINRINMFITFMNLPLQQFNSCNLAPAPHPSTKEPSSPRTKSAKRANSVAAAKSTLKPGAKSD